MEKTIFEISKIHCPSEENLIRVKLNEISEIKNFDFDIPGPPAIYRQAVKSVLAQWRKMNREKIFRILLTLITILLLLVQRDWEVL